MRGVFTNEERAVVLFLAVSLLVGSALAQANRVFPSAVPRFDGSSIPVEVEAGAEGEQAWPIDVNAAPESELVRLPGIGPVRAREIVRLREQRGGFDALDELLDVRGIGPVTLEKLRDRATVGAALESPPDSSATSGKPVS